MLNYLRSAFLFSGVLKRFEFHLINIISQEQKIMTTIDEIGLKVTTLIDHVATESTRAIAMHKDMSDQIIALQAKVQSGSPATPATQADLDKLLAQLDGVIIAVDKIIPLAPTVPAIPPTAPQLS